MKLRDYQDAAVKSIFHFFRNGGMNPLVALPTGTGKSLVLSEFIRQAYTQYPGQRIIQLTHVKELIEQNHKTMLKLWPTAPAGIFSAGLGIKHTCFPITFGGIASVVKVPGAFGRVDLVLIDEAHLLSPKQNTMYQQFLTALRQVNPYLRVIGFTATHYRVGQGLLTEGGGVFTDICFDLTTLDSFNWLLDQGYLSPLIPKRTQTELNTDEVRIQGGEFVQKDLQAAVDKRELTTACLKETISLGHNRSHWLMFASGIDHACHIRDTLELLGVSATVVHSRMSDHERDENIANFKAGKYRAMVNNGILTTGFDFPEIDLIGMLRPTQSPGLWVQMLGRGTRPVYAIGFDLETRDGRLRAIEAGPKQNCLVLDFAGNTRRLGPINDPVIPRRKGLNGGSGSAPIKICEVCGTYNHASVRFCIACKNEFLRAVKLAPQASTDELIRASLPKVEIFNVDRVVYYKHTKQDKPDSIRVSYYCGLSLFQEWVCLEHEGLASKKARDWWRERSLPMAYEKSNPGKVDQYYLHTPETTEEALLRLQRQELKVPRRIRVWINKKHPEIMGYEY